MVSSCFPAGTLRLLPLILHGWNRIQVELLSGWSPVIECKIERSILHLLIFIAGNQVPIQIRNGCVTVTRNRNLNASSEILDYSLQFLRNADLAPGQTPASTAVGTGHDSLYRALDSERCSHFL